MRTRTNRRLPYVYSLLFMLTIYASEALGPSPAQGINLRLIPPCSPFPRSSHRTPTKDPHPCVSTMTSTSTHHLDRKRGRHVRQGEGCLIKDTSSFISARASQRCRHSTLHLTKDSSSRKNSTMHRLFGDRGHQAWALRGQDK